MKKFSLFYSLIFLTCIGCTNQKVSQDRIIHLVKPNEENSILLTNIFDADPDYHGFLNNPLSGQYFTLEDVRYAYVDLSGLGNNEIVTAITAPKFRSRYGYSFEIWQRSGDDKWKPIYDDRYLPELQLGISDKKINGMFVIHLPYELAFDGTEYQCPDCPELPLKSW